jgi:hypothetical protein
MRAPGLAAGVAGPDRLGSGTAANSASPSAQAEEHQLGLLAAPPARGTTASAPSRRAAAAARRAEQAAASPIGSRRAGGIGAEVVGAVERLAGEGDRHAGRPARALSLSTAVGELVGQRIGGRGHVLGEQLAAQPACATSTKATVPAAPAQP